MKIGQSHEFSSPPIYERKKCAGRGCLDALSVFSLKFNSKTIQASGLLDTGSTVNVLPFHLGIELGADWDSIGNPFRLAGNLANFEAKPLILECQVADFKPVRLVFAWTKNSQVPVILGQTNFFMEFNVCFYRADFSFELRPK